MDMREREFYGVRNGYDLALLLTMMLLLLLTQMLLLLTLMLLLFTFMLLLTLMMLCISIETVIVSLMLVFDVPVISQDPCLGVNVVIIVVEVVEADNVNAQSLSIF